MLDGEKLPFLLETRWSRLFSDEKRGKTFVVSRFMDGSTSISIHQLREQWPSWSESERCDFCQACGSIENAEELTQIVRFVLEVGSLDECSGVALDAARVLPRDEAFDLLVAALDRSRDGRALCNLLQGIAATKHPGADILLREQLERLWASPQLWEHDSFTNWTAYDAQTCIQELLNLGASPSEFEAKVRMLAEHSCDGIRQSCRTFLGKYYPWLEMEV